MSQIYKTRICHETELPCQPPVTIQEQPCRSAQVGPSRPCIPLRGRLPHPGGGHLLGETDAARLVEPQVVVEIEQVHPHLQARVQRDLLQAHALLLRQRGHLIGVLAQESHRRGFRAFALVRPDPVQPEARADRWPPVDEAARRGLVGDVVQLAVAGAIGGVLAQVDAESREEVLAAVVAEGVVGVRREGERHAPGRCRGMSAVVHELVQGQVVGEQGDDVVWVGIGDEADLARASATTNRREGRMRSPRWVCGGEKGGGFRRTTMSQRTSAHFHDLPH